ncbi:MAG: hypothetical protein C0591_08135 [Marinilabiliales bacterium]|nr:MAG: hypothetical protein C0591_08135 [Marinilabiliales bacterium]
MIKYKINIKYGTVLVNRLIETKNTYKMKALHTTKTIMATLAVLFAFNLNAGSLTIAEENYIHDIPFNTNEIYNEILISSGVLDFDFSEEAYINDIPFNTECITVDCLYEKAVEVTFEMEEENYIDDIPFNTECISAECRYKRALQQNFAFDEELYIDDIPFETAEIINSIENTQFAMSK